MTDKAISPLRRRMIEDMTIRKLAPKTQASCIRAVRNFTIFLGRSPDQARAEDMRGYQLHLASSGVAVPSQNATVTALRFFFTVTLARGEVTDRMPFVREPRKLPVVLSPEEVARLPQAAPGLKYRAALSVAYGAGLRANEVISLKIGGRASSCRCACSRVCSGDCSWRGWPQPTTPAVSTSSALMRCSPAAAPSRPIWRRCAKC
jgi:integrase/recombinase XerD